MGTIIAEAEQFARADKSSHPRCARPLRFAAQLKRSTPLMKNQIALICLVFFLQGCSYHPNCSPNSWLHNASQNGNLEKQLRPDQVCPHFASRVREKDRSDSLQWCNEQWPQFAAKIQSGDEVWFYDSVDSEEYVIVRGCDKVADFPTIFDKTHP